MASKLPKIKLKKLPKLPNIKINIDGTKASIKTVKGKTTAKFKDYYGSVTEKAGRINVNLKKKKPKGLFGDLF